MAWTNVLLDNPGIDSGQFAGAKTYYQVESVDWAVNARFRIVPGAKRYEIKEGAPAQVRITDRKHAAGKVAVPANSGRIRSVEVWPPIFMETGAYNATMP